MTLAQDPTASNALELACVRRRAGIQSDDDEVSPLLVSSEQMRQLLGMTERVARTSATVLILGETGSGKELIAQELHRRSTRRDAPLRVVNCAALPDSLVEGILFGHERGAYTGAHQSAPGVFEQARGGTAFLDEVGELSPRAQAALLRFLETKLLTRIGGQQDVAVDVRVVAATHRDLDDMVATNEFRRDLLYRLNTVTLCVPPLRERRSEIAALAELFLSRACTRWNLPEVTLEPEAIRSLEDYVWPGNIRELRNVVEQLAMLSDSPRITRERLPRHVRERHLQPSTAAGRGRETAPLNYRERVQRFEAELIAQALQRCEGNRNRASRELGIPLRTLLTKIRSFGVEG